MQAGVQAFGYALFFMNEKALEYLSKSEGFELGVGPSIAILDHGMAGSLSTTTARSDIYAAFFDQKGLMAGLGIQGTCDTGPNDELCAIAGVEASGLVAQL